jgi:hypothetical protein
MQVHVADSIRMCLYRFSGTAVGAFIGIVAILLFPENRPTTLLAATLTVMSTIGSGALPRLDELSHARYQAENRLLELHEGGATRRFHLQKLVQFFAFYHGAHSMGKAILRYGRQLG